MKKFLLGTTALISLSAASAAMAGGAHEAAPVAAPANTGGLTVMVGGKFNFQSVFMDQDENATIGVGDKDNFFRNDTQLNFTAAGSTEDFDYGAVIEVEADGGADKNGINAPGALGSTGTSVANPFGGGIGKLAYLYIENDSAGRFEAGSNVGASSTLEVDASKAARATGGVDGDWRYNVNGTQLTPVPGVATAATGTTYVLTPNLVTGDDDTVAGRANKITYYTPRFSGAQVGVSYTPDTGDRGTAASITPNTGVAGTATSAAIASNYTNVIAGGVNYESDFEGFGIMASAVGEIGQGEPGAFGLTPELNDLATYSLGLGVEFGGFTIAGNWAELGDSLTLSTATTEQDTSYWSLGAGYENGPYGVSVTYLNSEQGTGAAAGAGANTGTNELQNIVVGADYQMAPGLTPFVEASFFELDAGSTTTAYDNDGTVVLVGAEVAF